MKLVPLFSFRARTLFVGFLAIALSGCAADRAFQAGREGVDHGRYEEGLTQLEEAVKLEPTNGQYRAAVRTGREQAVRRLLLDAERQYGAGQVDEAEKTLHRVLGIEPQNQRAQAGLEMIAQGRRHQVLMQQAQKLFQAKELNRALGKAREILAENPKYPEAVALLQKIEDLQTREAHAPLKIDTGHIKPVSLQFRDANIRMVFEALSKTTGINFIFDNDVKNSLKVTIFVSQVRVEDAIDLILAQSQLAQKTLNDNTLLIYPATPQKQKEYQEQIVKSFYLTNMDPKKAQSMLKTMLDINTAFLDERSNLLMVRDTPEAVRMAEKLLEASDLPEPEVMLEVEVLEVKRSRLQQLGIDFPDKVGLSILSASGSDSLTLEDLKHINPSRVGVSPLSVGIDVAKQDSDANLLASPRIRARNHEKAKIHIGDKVPVITNSVTPTTTGPGLVTGSVQYLDVGLKLEIEPTVHLDNDVAIKVNLEVSSIVREITNGTPETGSTVAYQIGTRNASTVLRLKDGETQVLAGLINDDERTSANKVPGLGDLPILGHLFSTQKDDSQKTEIVLSITPRLIRNIVRPDAGVTEFWYGTEARKRGKPLIIESVAKGESLRPAQTVGAKKNPFGLRPHPASAPSANAPDLTAADEDVESSTNPFAPPARAPAPKSDAAPTLVPLSFNAPGQVKIGDEFDLAVKINAGQAVNGVKFQLGYEPAVFQVVSVRPGAYVERAGAGEHFTQSVDATEGHIDVAAGPAEGPGFSGAAEVVIVTLRAVSEASQSPVTMASIALQGPGGTTVKALPPGPLSLVAKP